MIEIDKGLEWITQHGGPVVRWDGRHAVVGDGLLGWWTMGLDPEPGPLELSKHIDETNGTRMLKLSLRTYSALNAGPVRWESTLKIGTGRYVRSAGYAPDFPTALSLAETHVHESREMGSLTWWCESETQWVSWLGPFDLRTTKIEAQGRDLYWHFEARGQAPTLEEAALLAVMAGKCER